MSNSTPIVEAEVIDYLKDHPDFFNKHLELLGSLDIPHQSGQAVSLVERQLQALRQSNNDLKARFDQLMDVARVNEKHFENTKLFTLNLLDFHIRRGSLSELVELFDTQFPKILAAHAYRLVLIDYPESNIASNNLLCVESAQLKESAPKLHNLKKSFCGGLTKAEKEIIFGLDADKVASFALIPLQLDQGQCFIAVGNRQEKYFHKGMGTVFLDYIGELSGRIITDIKSNQAQDAIAV